VRVLIAEDDPASRKILETMLTNWGHEVVVTNDGNEAWERLQEADAPKLAILDWMMPGLDGVEVCTKLREVKTQVPTYVILLTARGSTDDIVAGLRAGADDYVIKPFDKNELNARVEVGGRVVELQTALSDRINDLQNALGHIETLQGILPICSHCHKIRNDTESWERIENYIEGHSEAQFSHSICPECLDKYYPEEPEDEKQADEESEKVESKK